MGRAIRSLPGWAKVAISGLAVTSVSFGALASAGAATKAIPGGTVHGCIYVKSNRTLERVYTNPNLGTTCPTGTVQVIWSIKGPRGPQGVPGPQGSPGPQGPAGQDAILSVSAQTQVTNWPEGGGWANDNFTRMVTITRQHAAPASDCGASASRCWFYTETLSDNGTSVPVNGHGSPNTSHSGATITAANISGNNMTGGGKLEFYADSGTPDPSKVPGTATGTSKPQSSTSWYKLFFPQGTNFGLAPAQVSGYGPWTTYDWNYTANVTYQSGATTISCTQTWNDAINPGDDGQGPVAKDGDITGTCPTP